MATATEKRVLRMTPKLRAAIRAAVAGACGGRRMVEVGARHWPGQDDADDGYNFLTWGDDNDLSETDSLAVVRAVQTRPDGWVALDLYCYTYGADGELDCNCYCLIDPAGSVVYCTQDDRGHTAAIQAILKAAGAEPYTPN